MAAKADALRHAFGRGRDVAIAEGDVVGANLHDAAPGMLTSVSHLTDTNLVAFRPGRRRPRPPSRWPIRRRLRWVDTRNFAVQASRGRGQRRWNSSRREHAKDQERRDSAFVHHATTIACDQA